VQASKQVHKQDAKMHRKKASFQVDSANIGGFPSNYLHFPENPHVKTNKSLCLTMLASSVPQL
jgi:hypothetical protein